MAEKDESDKMTLPSLFVQTSMFSQAQPAGVLPSLSSFPAMKSPTLQETLSSGTRFLPHFSEDEPHIPSTKLVTKGRRPKSLGVANVPAAGVFPERPMCRSCGKYFMSRQQLNQHMLVHTDVRKYKCTYCERSFKQPSHLHQHHRIHTGDKPYRCPVAGCSRAFPQQSNLNHHLRNHDKPAPPPENTCTLCMRVYASETVLRSHIAKIHFCDPDTILGTRSTKSPKATINKTTNNNRSPVSENLQTKAEDTSTESYLNDSHLPPSVNRNFSYDFTKQYLDRLKSVDPQGNSLHDVADNLNGVFDESVHELNHVEKEPERTENQNDILNYNYTLKDGDDDLLKHYVLTTTESGYREIESNINTVTQTNGFPSAKTNENKNENNNLPPERCGLKRKLSDDGESLDLSTSERDSNSNLSGSEILSRDGLFVESSHSNIEIPANVGRSRKRKAFQPQRIVHNIDYY